jgi:sporulation integral membrane protein YtvI
VDSGALVSLVEDIVGFFESILSGIPFLEQIERIPALEGVRDNIDGGITELVQNILSRVVSYLSGTVMGAVGAAPRLFLGFFVALLSAYYFATDYEGIKRGILSVFSKEGRERASRIGGAVISSRKKYARAYLLIMLIAFCEMFLGLVILSQSYAYLLAIIIALIDILPVLGAGTVLVPWGIVALLGGDLRLGAGLLVLYGVSSIIRELIEPKIVGESLGIHPLASLFASFAGLTLFGIFGMIVAPFAVLLIKEIFLQKDDAGSFCK